MHILHDVTEYVTMHSVCAGHARHRPPPNATHFLLICLLLLPRQIADDKLNTLTKVCDGSPLATQLLIQGAATHWLPIDLPETTILNSWSVQQLATKKSGQRGKNAS